MPRTRKQHASSAERTAGLIEKIAQSLANGDYSFDLQSLIVRAEKGLLSMQHRDGLALFVAAHLKPRFFDRAPAG